MKAITLHQPWASLVALGVKTIETRSWSTKVRGRIAIHAGATRVAHCASVGGVGVYRQDADRLLVPGVLRAGAFDRVEGATWVDLVYGAIVATAELIDCVPITSCSERTHHVCASVGDVYEHWPLEGRHPDETERLYAGQQPYGDFTPGRYAWLLDDIKPTTERCPACWGEGGFKEDSMILYGIPGGEDWAYQCSVCKGQPGIGSCPPIPAKGRQGWWEWTP